MERSETCECRNKQPSGCSKACQVLLAPPNLERDPAARPLGSLQLITCAAAWRRGLPCSAGAAPTALATAVACILMVAALQ